MRSFVLVFALLFASPVLADWRAVSDETCRIEGRFPAAEVTVTHFPLEGLYSIFVTNRVADWPEAPVFAISFRGVAPRTITTDRHFFPDGDVSTVSVIDQGFGNVLDGLAGGGHAVARLGGTELSVPLDGAAPAVEQFRACIAAISA